MINYKLINYCEFDKYAAKAYSLIHNEPESKNLGDITKVNEKQLENFNVMTWGFPCTDISVAGKGKGFIDEDGNKTRSGLYYDGLRILQENKPALSIIENVKNLTSKKFKDVFDQILKDLEEAGYNNYWQVLNAKDYGVPQNRERVFIVSIRKDVDNGKFKFPQGFDNGIRLKNLLEDKVDEKYYISQEKTDKLIEQLMNKNISNTMQTGVQEIAMQINNGKVKVKENDICSYIDANYGKGLDNHASRTGIMQVGMLDIKGNEQVRRVYDPEGLSPTLNSMQGGNRQPKIIEENELKFIGGIDTTDKWIDNEKELSRNYKEGYRVYDSEGIACCQKTNGGGLGSHTGLYTVKGCSTRTRNYIDQPEQLEIRNDELSNSITTVQKDSMALELTNKPMKKYNINNGGQGERVYDTNGISVALSSNYNGRDVLLEHTESPSPELVGGIGEINFGKQYRQGNRVYDADKTAMCLLSQPVGNTGGNSYLYEIDYRIRKLTPLECFRLMGFDDEDYYILKDNKISNTQIYKMAGNSIVVSVLYYILIELYKAMPYLLEDIKLSSFFSGIGAFEKAILRLKEIIDKKQFKEVINH